MGFFNGESFGEVGSVDIGRNCGHSLFCTGHNQPHFVFGHIWEFYTSFFHFTSFQIEWVVPDFRVPFQFHLVGQFLGYFQGSVTNLLHLLGGSQPDQFGPLELMHTVQAFSSTSFPSICPAALIKEFYGQVFLVQYFMAEELVEWFALGRS